MRLGIFALLPASMFWSVAGGAQDAGDIERIANTMVRLCVAGGRTEAVSGGGAGGADLSLRSLDVKGNLKGEFKITKSNAEGLVGGIENAMTQIAADEADKVRACLEPVRQRLLDVMLPPKPNRQGYEHPDEKSGLEPNLSITTAKSITEGKTVSGSLVPGQDRHFFQFQASSTKIRVILRKRSKGGFQGAVDIYDHNENLVAREAEGVALVGPGQDQPITLSFESHPGELYYIAVTALGSKTSSDYELTARKE